VTPIMACRRLKIRVRTFFAQTFGRPALAVLPWAVCLVVARGSLTEHPALAAAFVAFGGLSLAFVYWQWVLPEKWKRRFRQRFPRLVKADMAAAK